MEAQVQPASFPAAGGSGTLRISINRECAWSIQSDAAWLTLSSPVSGQGAASVQYTVAANPDPSSRSVGISVEDQRLQISQEGRPCEYRVSSTRESVDPSGGERTIHVSAGSAQCRWTSAAEVPWITVVTGREGSGNGAVSFSVEATSGPERTGTVTAAGMVITITQSRGCSYVVEPSAYAIPSSGGTSGIAVRTGAGCLWTAASTADWITVVAGASGSGAGEVRSSVAPWTGPSRTAALRIADKTVTVSQGAGCIFSLTPSTLSVGAPGGQSTVQVGSMPGCLWSANGAAPWISIAAGGSGNGDGQMQLSVAANSGPTREGSLTIAGRSLTVVQASGCTYGVTPPAQDVGGAGTVGVVSVATGGGCRWTATSNADWMTVQAPSSAGAGQMTFTVAANPGPARTGSLTVAGHLVTVNQASQCSWTLAPPNHQFDAPGGNGNVLVIVGGSCTWTASSNVDWITLTAGTSGAGNGLVQFAAAPNVGPARTGSLTIAGQRYDVIQGGTGEELR